MSDRPPYFNPSYPAYPGPPGGIYPPLHDRNHWPPPSAPGYNSSMYPGHPGPPVTPAYPALRPGGIDRAIFGGHVVPPHWPPRGPPASAHCHVHSRPHLPPHSWQPCTSSCSSWPGTIGGSITVATPTCKTHNQYFGWTPPPTCTGSLQFVPASGGTVPPDAVHGGQDRDGGPIYVGRAYHERDLLPAKICPTHGCAFISYCGQEITKIHYEVLCSTHVAWKYARDGEYPPEAIRVGMTEEGEPLFVGRTMLEGTMTPGKVHPSHRVLYVPYDGREVSFPEYEILILN